MINILISGDFCPIGKIEELCLKGDYPLVFNDFIQYLKESDFNVTNLECPLINNDNPINKFGPLIRANRKTVDLLKYGNFNLVTLANNHIMDHGSDGLYSTIDTLTENGIDFVGVGETLREAKKPYFKTIKGKTLSFLNFAENEFSTTHGLNPGANPISLATNFMDIKTAKESSNYVIVIVHGGNEMYQLPSPRFKETLRFYVEAGANAVIAHHTHCFSGYEIYKNAPIVYGLGNFLFDRNRRNDQLWTIGIVANLMISEDNISLKIIPYSQNKGNKDGINLLNNSENKAFTEKINELNTIIQDDEKLQKEFLKFINLKKRQYFHFLEPYTNRILHGLYGKGIIPSLINKKKRMLYLNLIRCESHRDIILELLKK